MRVRMLVLAFLLAGLAGCVGETNDTADVAIDDIADVLMPGLLPSGEPAPLRLDYTGCDEILGVFPTPMDQVWAPEGFTIVPFDEAGMFATVIALGYTCTVGGEPVTELFGSVEVLPPEHLQAEEEPFAYAVHLGAFTDREDLHDVYEAWHFGDAVELTDVSLNQRFYSPAVRIGELVAGNGAIRMESTVPGQATTGEAGFVRTFVAPDLDEAEPLLAYDVTWTEGMVTEAGQAELVFEDAFFGLPVVQPGLSYHWYGDDYDYVVEYVPLSHA